MLGARSPLALSHTGSSSLTLPEVRRQPGHAVQLGPLLGLDGGGSSNKTEKKPRDLLLPPAETVRHRLMIASAIVNAGIVEAIPLIDPADADVVAAMMIALATTQESLDEMIALAAHPGKTLDRLASHIEEMRLRIAEGDDARLRREARTYANEFRNSTPRVRLPDPPP